MVEGAGRRLVASIDDPALNDETRESTDGKSAAAKAKEKYFVAWIVNTQSPYKLLNFSQTPPSYPQKSLWGEILGTALIVNGTADPFGLKRGVQIDGLNNLNTWCRDLDGVFHPSEQITIVFAMVSPRIDTVALGKISCVSEEFGLKVSTQDRPVKEL